jgi:hypothetical protein
LYVTGVTLPVLDELGLHPDPVLAEALDGPEGGSLNFAGWVRVARLAA